MKFKNNSQPNLTELIGQPAQGETRNSCSINLSIGNSEYTIIYVRKKLMFFGFSILIISLHSLSEELIQWLQNHSNFMVYTSTKVTTISFRLSQLTCLN